MDRISTHGTITALAVAIVSALALAPGAGEASAPVQGDVNCDGVVEAVDALGILRSEAGLAAHAGCVGESGDLDCDGASDKSDARLVLEHVAGMTGPHSEPCPYAGAGLRAPVVDISCSNESVAVGEVLECRYDVGESPASPSIAVEFDGGDAEMNGPSLSVMCPPAGSPCVYSVSATYDVVFDEPGEKTLTVEACAWTYCTDGSFSVSVE